MCVRLTGTSTSTSTSTSISSCSLLLLLLLLLSCAGLGLSTPRKASGPSSGIWRLQRELKQYQKENLSFSVPFNRSDPNDPGVRLQPVRGSNLREWHFSFVGMNGSDYEQGIYHGIIRLDNDYPMSAPSVRMCTPSGRFAVDKQLCLSGATNFHPETFQSTTNLRSIVISIPGFMSTREVHHGYVEATAEVRRMLALQSRYFKCSVCGYSHDYDSRTPVPEIRQTQLKHPSLQLQSQRRKRVRWLALLLFVFTLFNIFF